MEVGTVGGGARVKAVRFGMNCGALGIFVIPPTSPRNCGGACSQARDAALQQRAWEAPQTFEARSLSWALPVVATRDGTRSRRQDQVARVSSAAASTLISAVCTGGLVFQWTTRRSPSWVSTI